MKDDAQGQSPVDKSRIFDAFLNITLIENTFEIKTFCFVFTRNVFKMFFFQSRYWYWLFAYKYKYLRPEGQRFDSQDKTMK